MRHFPIARNFAVLGDELLGYDKPNLKDKWWFDLEKEGFGRPLIADCCKLYTEMPHFWKETG